MSPELSYAQFVLWHMSLLRRAAVFVGCLSLLVACAAPSDPAGTPHPQANRVPAYQSNDGGGGGGGGGGGY